MALTNYQKILINRPLPPGTALDKNGNPILVKSDFTSTNWEKVRFTTFSHANAVKNKKGCIPLMFEYDSRLNCIWNNPAKYLSKLSTFMAIPTPDFSVYSDMNKKEIEHNVFKSRWLGVWAQYYGCKIIPTITWGDDTTYDLCFSGIEKGSVVAISTIGCQKCKKEFLSGFFEMKKRLCPSLIIVKGKIIEGMSGYLIPISFEETFSIKKSYEQLPLFIQKKLYILRRKTTMGGRGTKLDVDKYLRLPSSQRTAEYESIYYEGNIKFLVQKKGARTAAPIFSNTAGRIYVTINQRGKIVAITKYDEKHEAEFTIHEPHSGEMNEVHMHSSFKTGRKKTSWEHMSQYQKNLYWEIKQKYDAYNISSLMLKWNETHGK